MAGLTKTGKHSQERSSQRYLVEEQQARSRQMGNTEAVGRTEKMKTGIFFLCRKGFDTAKRQEIQS